MRWYAPRSAESFSLRDDGIDILFPSHHYIDREESNLTSQGTEDIAKTEKKQSGNIAFPFHIL